MEISVGAVCTENASSIGLYYQNFRRICHYHLFIELIQSAREGRSDMVKELLEKGADITERDLFGRTPLHWATKM